MKMRRITGLLLTAACAVSLLCPAAWAASALSPTTSVEGANVKISYRYGEQAVEDATKLGTEVRQQVKTTARRTSNSWVNISVSDRTSAENMLGMQFASSTALDALQKQSNEYVEVFFKPSQKVTNTNYVQYWRDGGNLLCLQANTRWDDGSATTGNVWTVPGASAAVAPYTAQTGETYQICSVKDQSGAIVQQYTMFQNGSTIYSLTASGASLPAGYLYGILDTMTFPA